MKKKLVVCFLVIFLMCGCSAEVNLTVDKNNKVSENIKVSEDNSMLINNSADSYVNDEIEYQNININGYKKNIFNDGEFFGVNLSKETDSICDFLNDSSIKDYFSKLTCTSSFDYYEISGVTTITYCHSDAMYCSNLKNLKITIELPEKALNNNANSVDGKKYTWNFDRNTKEGKINLKIKKNNTNIKTTNLTNNDASKNDKYFILILIGAILFVVFIGITLYDKYKKNKIEY